MALRIEPDFNKSQESILISSILEKKRPRHLHDEASPISEEVLLRDDPLNSEAYGCSLGAAVFSRLWLQFDGFVHA